MTAGANIDYNRWFSIVFGGGVLTNNWLATGYHVESSNFETTTTSCPVQSPPTWLCNWYLHFKVPFGQQFLLLKLELFQGTHYLVHKMSWIMIIGQFSMKIDLITITTQENNALHKLEVWTSVFFSTKKIIRLRGEPYKGINSTAMKRHSE